MADAALPWLAACAFAFNSSALLAIGLGLHAVLVVERAAVRPYLVGAAIFGGVALGLAGVKLALVAGELGSGFSDALSPGNLSLAWTALGAADLAVIIAAVLLALGAGLRRPLAAFVGALTLASGFGLTGHTEGLPQPAEAPVIVALHVLIAGFWAAAPISLAPSASRSDLNLIQRLTRFSTVALLAIPLMVLAGLWLVYRILGGLYPLVASDYGRLILVKLVAAVLAIGAGAINKTLIPAMLAADGERGRSWLYLTLRVEGLSFAAAILAVSLATTAWPPND